MSPTEDYFFSNNIEVWGFKKTDSYTWFNTEDRMFIQNSLGHLYKEDDGKCERVV
ncbi:hypothetical protein [Vagococcus fluvialis]|uniref:hypothetical protein n=1 Tax=Vagococcus fluvialis TaxID=2738 RepID=UPI00378CC1FE